MSKRLFYLAFAALLSAVFILPSCGSVLPKSPAVALLKTPLYPMAQKAIDDFAPDRSLQVVCDSVHTSPIETDFFTTCENYTVSLSASVVNEVNAGTHYHTETTCQKVPGQWYAGFIYVLTVEDYTGENVWVSCPAILYDKNPKGKIRVSKKYISLNQNGSNAEYLFMQQ